MHPIIVLVTILPCCKCWALSYLALQLGYSSMIDLFQLSRVKPSHCLYEEGNKPWILSVGKWPTTDAVAVFGSLTHTAQRSKTLPVLRVYFSSCCCLYFLQLWHCKWYDPLTQLAILRYSAILLTTHGAIIITCNKISLDFNFAL